MGPFSLSSRTTHVCCHIMIPTALISIRNLIEAGMFYIPNGHFGALTIVKKCLSIYMASNGFNCTQELCCTCKMASGPDCALASVVTSDALGLADDGLFHFRLWRLQPTPPPPRPRLLFRNGLVPITRAFL